MDRTLAVSPNIALYGRSGSGKSTVANYLVATHGYQHARTGVACRKLCRELFASESKTLMNEVTDALRRIDPSVWLRAGLASVQEGHPVVFDSMRFAEDYRFFYHQAYVLVDVEASLDLRVSRLRKRGQSFDPPVDENHPAESELESFTFDVTLDNIGDLDEFRMKIDQMLSRRWEDLNVRRNSP